MIYQPKLPRWTHQNKALHTMNGAPAFALLMEMRTGKTKVILDEFGQDVLDGRIENLLVVAPAGVYRTWEVDAAKHLADEFKARVRIGRWESDAPPAAKRSLTDAMKRRGPKILLVNVEALSTVDAAKVLCTLFLTQGPTTMVIDESTTIKNHKAKRTKFCLRAGLLAKKRRILSGMPTPQSPLDIFAQFGFLDPRIIGHSSFERFQARYAVVTPKPFGPGGRLINTVSGYQNLPELKAKLQPYAYRVRLADCYDLPEKMYLRRDVELTPEQRVAYAQMQAFATTVLENTERVTATIVLTQLLRLHQILAGHTKSDNGIIVDIPENKTAEVLSILAEHPGKAIIWAAYDADIRKIARKITEVYGEGSVARFWGGNADTREDEEKQFKTDPKCRFMVATASAGGRGRTWDVADLMIYYSTTFSLEHRMQSEERAQMVGKTDHVAYFDLICRNTVEDKIVDALRNKKRLSDMITGDRWKEWIAP
jgi:SNF2 family DNA or RNA helicase